MDYGKYLYNLQKQIAKQRAHVHEVEIKEVRLGVKIGDHDLQVKENKITKFFNQGDKVKVTIQLRGREMIFQNRVRALMDRIITDTNAIAEGDMGRMGNRFSVVLNKAK